MAKTLRGPFLKNKKNKIFKLKTFNKRTDQHSSKVSGIGKTWKLRNGHNFKETNTTGQLNAIWNPGLDPGAESRHYLKIDDILIWPVMSLKESYPH